MAKRKPEVELTESHSLPTPTGLSVWAVTGDTVRLTWNLQDNVDGLHLERSKDGENWREVTGDTGRGGHTDNGVEPGQTYQYRVYAVVGGERSVYSEPVVAMTTG